MVFARNGQEIKIGHRYMFAEVGTGCEVIRTVTEIIDENAVRIDDGWGSSRWSCNALFEIPDGEKVNGSQVMPELNSDYWDEQKAFFKRYE